jgi:hypothetical protein
VWQKMNGTLGKNIVGNKYDFPKLDTDRKGQKDLYQTTDELFDFLVSITPVIDKFKGNNRIGTKKVMLDIVYMFLVYMDIYGSKKNGMNLRQIVLSYQTARKDYIDNSKGKEVATVLAGNTLSAKATAIRTRYAKSFLRTTIARAYKLKELMNEN